MNPPFAAVVLAGDRRADDPLLRAGGVASKALLPVAGTPMVLRVLETLAASRHVRSRLLCGPSAPIMARVPDLQALVDSGRVDWLENDASPSRSAARALARLPGDRPVLLTTADHALLSPAMVDHFCERALASGAEVVVGLAPYPRVAAAFPGARRTVLKLDQGYCGCNLFAFLTPAGRATTGYWQQLEARRKQPLKMLASIGWGVALRYALGRLDLHTALAVLSRRVGARAGAVLMPFPEAAVDVDTPADWRFVESLARTRVA